MSADRDELLRAEGRRQADNAVLWGVSCVGCADRLDGLIAERAAGGVEAARSIAARLRAQFAAGGGMVWLEAAAVADTYAEDGAQINPAGSEPFAEGSGNPPA